MQLTSFAQTCGTYDNKTFRRPSFYQHTLHPSPKPLPPRPQTPFPGKKRIDGIQGIKYPVAAVKPIEPIEPIEPTAVGIEIVNDAFDLHTKQTLNADVIKDYLDSDSDLSEDEETNAEKNKAWANYIRVTDLAEDTIKQTYYCRNCFEKFKSKFLHKIKNKNKNTSV